jgi:hypothetical protein
MLRKLIIWHARRKMGMSPYRIDRRHYRGLFRAGFFIRGGPVDFWEDDDDPLRRARRRRKQLLIGALFALLLLLGWFAFESLTALRLF